MPVGRADELAVERAEGFVYVLEIAAFPKGVHEEPAKLVRPKSLEAENNWEEVVTG